MVYVSPYHGLKDAKRVLRLATNENPHELNSDLVSILTASIASVNRYPNVVNDTLREKIAEKNAVNKENIIVSSGSDELIVLSAMLYVERGVNTLMCVPSFFRYAQVTQLMHGECRFVRCSNYTYDLDALLNSIDDKTRVIFICNPNNPTGTFLQTYEIEGFLRRVPSNILVVVDEAYFDFVYPKTKSASTLIDKYRNLLVLKTFSKFYGLAGLRIGYGLSNADLIKKLLSGRSQYSVNSLAQDAALEILNSQQDYYDNYYREVVNERQFLHNEFARLSINYYKSQANFVFADFGNDCESIIGKLREWGIIVRPCAMFDCPSFARITIGKHSENVKLIKELKSILKNK